MLRGTRGLPPAPPRPEQRVQKAEMRRPWRPLPAPTPSTGVPSQRRVGLHNSRDSAPARSPNEKKMIRTLTFGEHADEDVVPSFVGSVEAAIDEPDATQTAAVGVSVLQAASAGELRHQSRQQKGAVLLRGDLDGLVILFFANLDVATHLDHAGTRHSSFTNTHAAKTHRLERRPGRFRAVPSTAFGYFRSVTSLAFGSAETGRWFFSRNRASFLKSFICMSCF